MSNRTLPAHAPKWGINWQRYHADQWDMPHIEAMQYGSFTLYEWMWSDKDFCNELVAHAPKDAIFVCRDHPLSEEKDDQWKNDPAAKGRAHADEWVRKVQEGRVFLPMERTYFLGINEPDSNQFQRQIDSYNEALCRRMAQNGLRVAAYSFGVGHPSTVGSQPNAPVDWSPYKSSAAAILEGGHIVAVHEYGSPDSYGWGYWLNRIEACPYPFDVFYDECGIDYGVVDAGNLKGWSAFMDGESYVKWLDGMQFGLQERAHRRTAKVKWLGIFGYDHGSGDTKDWHSFDIRPIRPLLEAKTWSVKDTVPAPNPPPPVQPPVSAVVTHPCPAVTSISSRFKVAPAFPAWHAGIDLAAPLGSPVLALAHGVVAMVANDADYGNYIRVYHAHLGVHSFYSHLGDMFVRIGESVGMGRVLGRVGMTGNTTGPHLHLEIRVGNASDYSPVTPLPNGRIDPESYCALLGLSLADGASDQTFTVHLPIISAWGSSRPSTPAPDMNQIVLDAILAIESGGNGFAPDGRVKIRFEAHIFKDRLRDDAVFNNHFRVGSPPHTGQKMWNGSAWVDIHSGSQDNEWNAFLLASRINAIAAAESVSMGAGQIMGFNHARVGYASAADMLNAFKDRKNQDKAFLAFLTTSPILVKAVKDKDWRTIATYYNGAANVETYSKLLADKYRELGGR